MRFRIFTPSIILFAALVVLTGCDTFDNVDIRNPLRADQVPDEAKQETRLVKTVDTDTLPKDQYPRLADVPFKPKDFSPKPAYSHYMDQLEFDRAESDTAKVRVEAESPTLPEAAPAAAPQDPYLLPPQLSKE